jgi:integration host factor subunit beta
MDLDGLSKLTKADIVDAIYNKIGIERRGIRDVVDLFLEELKAALISNKVVELRGFGTFEIKIRKGREKARNPKTGEILSVNSHGIAFFRAGRELRQDVWTIRRKDQAVTNERPSDHGEGAKSLS